MLFNEFGDKNKKVILCMHGMCQDWHSEYEKVKPLEKDFRLIVPAMDVFMIIALKILLIFQTKQDR